MLHIFIMSGSRLNSDHQHTVAVIWYGLQMYFCIQYLNKTKKMPPRHKAEGASHIAVRRCYERRARKTPAATAEPMTPATFGPMACMRGFTRPSVESETNF